MFHIQSVVEEWIVQVIDQIKEVLPRVLLFILALIITYVAGRIFARVVAAILRRLEFERLTKKSEAERIARRFGMTLIELIEVVTRWTIYLIGLQIAVETTGLEFFNQLMQKVVSYMPNLILALIIFIVGILVAEKLGDFVQGLAEDEKVPRFWILGNLVRYTIYLIVVIMTLSQLGISTGVLMIVTGAIFATVGAIIVIGMKDIASNAVAGMYVLYEKTLNVGDNVQLREYEGIIEDIGFVKSVIKKKDGEYVMVPNSELMKGIIIRK